jgi:hypothetical protein
LVDEIGADTERENPPEEAFTWLENYMNERRLREISEAER